MNNTLLPPNTLALQSLYHWEKTAGQRVCLTQPMAGGEVQVFTWAEVLNETRRMAAHLQSLALAPGSRIAILSKNTAHWLMADWAIWMAGFVSVPLYPTLAAGTVRQILDHSEAQLLFVGKLDDWESMKAGVPEGLACISLPLAPPNPYPTWSSVIAGVAPLAGEPVRGGDELCTLMYTSGTTGNPKGVMHSFDNFARAITEGLARIPMDANYRILSYLPLSHIAERVMVEHALLATGMQLFFAESLDTFAQDLRRARPTFFFSVPRLWVKFKEGVDAKMPPAKLARMLKIPIVRGLVRKKVLTTLGLDQCRFAAGGAAPMPADLLRWYTALGLDIVEIYGMTENCGVSHTTLPGKSRPGTVGLNFPGVQCRLAPADSEIQMKSNMLMLGYFKEPQLSQESLTFDGWLRTGDKGAMDAEGNLKITGRVKDLFKTNKGKYVAPAPIEDKLALTPGVEACCVVGSNLGQPLALLMLSMLAAKQALDSAHRASLEAGIATKLAEVNATLDPHEQLSCMVVISEPWTVESGLITPTFKVKRNRIEEVYGNSFEDWTAQRKKVLWHGA